MKFEEQTSSENMLKAFRRQYHPLFQIFTNPTYQNKYCWIAFVWILASTAKRLIFQVALGKDVLIKSRGYKQCRRIWKHCVPSIRIACGKTNVFRNIHSTVLSAQVSKRVHLPNLKSKFKMTIPINFSGLRNLLQNQKILTAILGLFSLFKYIESSFLFSFYDKYMKASFWHHWSWKQICRQK